MEDDSTGKIGKTGNGHVQALIPEYDEVLFSSNKHHENQHRTYTMSRIIGDDFVESDVEIGIKENDELNYEIVVEAPSNKFKILKEKWEGLGNGDWTEMEKVF